MALYTIWLALNSWGAVLAGGYLVALFCSWLLQRKSQQPSLLTLYEPVSQASPYDHLATPAPLYPQWKMVNGASIQFHAVDEVEEYTGEDLSQMIERLKAAFSYSADMEMSQAFLEGCKGISGHFDIQNDPYWLRKQAHYPINEQARREINEVLAKKEF